MKNRTFWKRILGVAVMAIIALAFAACEGPEGPMGPPGDSGSGSNCLHYYTTAPTIKTQPTETVDGTYEITCTSCQLAQSFPFPAWNKFYGTWAASDVNMVFSKNEHSQTSKSDDNSYTMSHVTWTPIIRNTASSLYGYNISGKITARTGSGWGAIPVLNADFNRDFWLSTDGQSILVGTSTSGGYEKQ